MVSMTADGQAHSDVRSRLTMVRRYLAGSFLCAVALVLLSLGLLAWAVGARTHVMPAAFVAMMVVSTLGWVVVSVWRTAGGAGPSATVLTADEADLELLVAETAARLDLEAPAGTVVAPVADVWLDLSSGKPTLVVGAPLIWELPVDTLRLVLAQALALLPELQPSAMRMLQVLARLREADFQGNRSPLIGALVRHFVAGYESRAAALKDACQTAAAHRLRSADLVLADEHHEQIDLAQEAWAVLLTRWAYPAFRHGVAVTQLGRGMVDMLVDLRLAGVVPLTDAGEPLMSPSGSGRSLDERTSMLLAEAMDRADGETIRWDDYPERVLAQQDRRRSADLFAAIDRMLGRMAPASISTVIDVIENDWGATLESVLRDNDIDSDGEESAVVREHVTAALITLLVDTRKARRVLDWIHGQELVDCDGDTVALDAVVHRLVADRDGTPTRILLDRLGAEPDQPVLLAGTEREAVRVHSVIYGYRGLRQYHVAFSRDELLILRARFLGSTWRNVVGAQNPVVAAQQLLLGAKVGDLLGTYPAVARVPFTDIVSVHIRPRRIYPSCRARLRTPSRQITFSGAGDGTDLAHLFAAAVGDRVRSRGTDRSLFARGWPRVRTAALAVCLSGGLLMLAASAFYAYAATTQPYPAYVTSCTPRADGTNSWECAAWVDAPLDHHDLRVKARSPYPTGTPLDVRGVVLPVLPDAVIEGWFATNMFILWGAFGTVTTTASAFMLRRHGRRRQRPATD